MKSIKMLGAAVLGVLALTAVVGVAGASAAGTTLCKVNSGELACPEASQYPAGTAIKASLTTGTKAVLTTNITNIPCTGSTLEGSTSAQTGEPLPASITAATLTGCTLTGGQACTTTWLGLPYSASFKAGPRSIGYLTIKNANFYLVCGSWYNCTLTLNGWESRVKSGSPATFAAENLTTSKSGFVCPETATLNASYTITSPNPLYVAHS